MKNSYKQVRITLETVGILAFTVSTVNTGAKQQPLSPFPECGRVCGGCVQFTSPQVFVTALKPSLPSHSSDAKTTRKSLGVRAHRSTPRVD